LQASPAFWRCVHCSRRCKFDQINNPTFYILFLDYLKLILHARCMAADEPLPPTPSLLRHARYTYGVAMRRALTEAGYDDIPPNGLNVIGGLAIDSEEIPLSQLIRGMRLSKQSAGQLVDALVIRGYLERTPDPQDRSKLTVALTERGRAAAATQVSAREKIDAALVAKVGEENVERTRQTLAALIDLGDELELGVYARADDDE
jgi:DNA-binding MarR family transcriptional regulator